MIVAVYSTKGGVGKTSLSFALAKDLNMTYITNDTSESALKSHSRIYTKKIPLHDNTIYDFGGFESKEAFDIANKSDLVIVPTICEMNSLFKTLTTLKKIKNKNIIVLATMTEKEQDYVQVQMVVKKHFPDVEVMSFRRNKLLKNAMEANLGVIDFLKMRRDRHLYKGAYSDYKAIIDKIISVGKASDNMLK